MGLSGSRLYSVRLKQPILNRDFDRWDIANEESFREFFYLYTPKSTNFQPNLDKYNIQYILWDENIVTPFTKNREQVTFKNEIRQILDIRTRWENYQDKYIR
jgi:hypothetical protein